MKMLRFFDGLRKNDSVTSRGPNLHGIVERKRDRRVTELVISWMSICYKLYPLYPWTLLTNQGPLTNFLTPRPFINPCTIINPITNPCTTHTAHYNHYSHSPLHSTNTDS